MEKEKLVDVKTKNTQVKKDFQLSKHSKFLAIVRFEGKLRIAVGKDIIDDKKFDTFQQAENYIATKPFDLLVLTAMCALENYYNTKKEEPCKK